MKDADARALLRDLFDAALAAARPATCLAPYIARLQPPKGRTIVIGAGKASAAMARAVEDHWPHPLEGLVVTRYGYGEACKKIEIVEAAHPVPDEKGRAAAGRILEKVKGLTPDDLVLCLISGGASALLALPAPGLTLADKQAVNRALLKSGANIVEMNTVRKHLSAIKGGRLAIAAQPARVLSWLISDVPNDDPGVIGSGPTVPDRTTFADALAVLAKYRIDPPAAVRAHLEKGAAGEIEETPKPGDPRLARVETIMVATPKRSLEAAAAVARDRGLEVVMLGDNLEGEARELGARARASGARSRQARRQADGDPVRRRDHGDGARQGTRRTQRRIPAGRGDRRERRRRHLGPGGGYRRRRRRRGYRRRDLHARHPRPRARQRPRSAGHARRQ